MSCLRRSTRLTNSTHPQRWGQEACDRCASLQPARLHGRHGLFLLHVGRAVEEEQWRQWWHGMDLKPHPLQTKDGGGCEQDEKPLRRTSLCLHHLHRYKETVTLPVMLWRLLVRYMGSSFAAQRSTCVRHAYYEQVGLPEPALPNLLQGLGRRSIHGWEIVRGTGRGAGASLSLAPGRQAMIFHLPARHLPIPATTTLTSYLPFPHLLLAQALHAAPGLRPLL